MEMKIFKKFEGLFGWTIFWFKEEDEDNEFIYLFLLKYIL